MNTSGARPQEHGGSGGMPQSDQNHVIVSDIVVSKSAGLAAQEIEGVQVRSGSA